jgi:hypothetical protein
MPDMAGKVAIVAGAGSVAPGWGNGRATAVLLARQGASVFLVDRDGEQITDAGGTCAVHQCDATDSASVREMVLACVDRFGRIDTLVNNIGGSEPGNAVMMPEATWDRQIDLNLKTAFLGCKLRGPFNGLLRSRELCDVVQRVAAHVRFASSIPSPRNELAIRIVGRKWTAQYEFYAHRRLATEAKLAPAILDAVADSTYWELHLPFGGGNGTRGGIGQLGGKLTLEAMTELKMISLHRG